MWSDPKHLGQWLDGAIIVIYDMNNYKIIESDTIIIPDHLVAKSAHGGLWADGTNNRDNPHEAICGISRYNILLNALKRDESVSAVTIPSL